MVEEHLLLLSSQQLGLITSTSSLARTFGAAPSGYLHLKTVNHREAKLLVQWNYILSTLEVDG